MTILGGHLITLFQAMNRLFISSNQTVFRDVHLRHFIDCICVMPCLAIFNLWRTLLLSENNKDWENSMGNKKRVLPGSGHLAGSLLPFKTKWPAPRVVSNKAAREHYWNRVAAVQECDKKKWRYLVFTARYRLFLSLTKYLNLIGGFVVGVHYIRF